MRVRRQLQGGWVLGGAGRKLLLTCALLALVPLPSSAVVATGFVETTVFSGLTNPTNVRFAPDGRIFIAEKSGLIKVFDSLSDPTPDTFADLRSQVHDYWDRGLLGLALDPGFPTRPYVYALYTWDHPPAYTGRTSWGDTCPNPPVGSIDGCVVDARLVRLTWGLNGSNQNIQTAPIQTLLEGQWCSQFPSHSIGSVVFGGDGALYVSAGDGASFNTLDYGQLGGTRPDAITPLIPRNPCGDPPGTVGSILSPPTAEGGTLRSQDLRTPADPLGYDGTVLRIDPDTGAALPDNPLVGTGSTEDDRVIAFGLRNPFRMARRPGTNELWLGDVGSGGWEEVNRIERPTAAPRNFGWPCYEGVPKHGGWDALNLDLCESLYATPGAVTSPYWAYSHFTPPNQTECGGPGGASITAIAFYDTGTYPLQYDGALFVGDYTRRCVWVMRTGTNGLPDTATLTPFMWGGGYPVALEVGPGSQLYYVSLLDGTLRRIEYAAENNPPVAVLGASATSGTAPLEIQFDGSASTDPDAGDEIVTWEWDLDGDGAFDDSTAVSPSWIYETSGTVTVRLRVIDRRGLTATAQVQIEASNTAPLAVIDLPASILLWKVDDLIAFAGHADDAQEGAVPATGLTWKLNLHHCTAPADCHAHGIEEFPGVAGGSFNAPDHEYPSYIELILEARDSLGTLGTAVLPIYPATVDLSFDTAPTALQLSVGSTTETAPFDRTVIVGSRTTATAVTPQTLGAQPWVFGAWSDGGNRSHEIVAPEAPASYVASYLADDDGDEVANVSDNCPLVANALQEDGDADGVGNACDNCAALANADQADTDLDGQGDLCDGHCAGFPQATTITSLTPTQTVSGEHLRANATGLGPTARIFFDDVEAVVTGRGASYVGAIVPPFPLGSDVAVRIVNPEGCRTLTPAMLHIAPTSTGCGLLGAELLPLAAVALRGLRRRRPQGG